MNFFLQQHEQDNPGTVAPFWLRRDGGGKAGISPIQTGSAPIPAMLGASPRNIVPKRNRWQTAKRMSAIMGMLAAIYPGLVNADSKGGNLPTDCKETIVVLGDGNTLCNTTHIHTPSPGLSQLELQELFDIVGLLEQNPNPDKEARRLQECMMEAISNDQYEEARRCNEQAQAYLDTELHAHRLSMINKRLLDAQIAWEEAENPVTSATRIIELREEAEGIYAHIDREFGSDNHPDIRERVAWALFNKGVMAGQQGETEKEIDIYDEIDRRYGQDESPGVRKPVAWALINKGIMAGRQGETEKAIDIYDEIDRRYGKDESSDMRELIAKALVNKKNVILGKQGNARVVTIYGPRIQYIQGLNFRLAESKNEVSSNNSNSSNNSINFLGSDQINSPDMRKILTSARLNAAEALVILGKHAEAEQKIRQVMVALEASDPENAIMSFLLWLAKPETPLQDVRKAIAALPPDVAFDWSFNEIRPFAAQLPQPRQTQAQCFIAFFEAHHDKEKLDACLE